MGVGMGRVMNARKNKTDVCPGCRKRQGWMSETQGQIFIVTSWKIRSQLLNRLPVEPGEWVIALKTQELVKARDDVYFRSTLATTSAISLEIGNASVNPVKLPQELQDNGTLYEWLCWWSQPANSQLFGALEAGTGTDISGRLLWVGLDTLFPGTLKYL